MQHIMHIREVPARASLLCSIPFMPLLLLGEHRKEGGERDRQRGAPRGVPRKSSTPHPTPSDWQETGVGGRDG